MQNLSVLGIDIAKNVFHSCGMSRGGKVLFRKKHYRTSLLKFISQCPKCLIVMEACGGANYWAREFVKLGHEVKLIAPQFVKPYVKSNKNDHADAEAICEAALRPTMRFVSIKSVKQQDIQLLHRIRSRIQKSRNALSNEIRGTLLEYGVTIPRGISHVRKNLLSIVEEHREKLSDSLCRLLRDLYEEFELLDSRISELEKEIERIYRSNPVCQRLGKIDGVGPLTATAVVAQVGNPADFKNGRSLSAYFGLVPKQLTTGGKPRLLGISKRGDRYIRQLLIHGARAAMKQIGTKTDRRSLWAKQLIERRGFNKACVALANKNARVIWALMARETEFQHTAKV